MSQGSSEGISRRGFLKVGGATLGAAAFARALAPLAEWGAGLSMEELLQKHYRELTRDQLAVILRRLEGETARSYGREVTIRDVRPTEGRAVRLRAQPVASASGAAAAPRPATSRTTTTARRNSRTSACWRWSRAPWTWSAARVRLRPRRAGPGQVLHAGAVPAVRQPALHQRVPRRGHLAGARRHRRGRLQLVHRLPLLRGRVPVPRAALQLDRPEIPRRRSTPTRRTCPTASGRRAWWRSAPSASTARARAAARVPRGLPHRRAGVWERARPQLRDSLGARKQARVRPERGARDEAALLLLLRRVRPAMNPDESPRGHQVTYPRFLRRRCDRGHRRVAGSSTLDDRAHGRDARGRQRVGPSRSCTAWA
jgi:hypothetical protein